MRRGTRVGQAYVSVNVDGDGINEEIVNSVDEAGPGVERAGEDHGDRYGDKFSDGFFARLRKKFGKQIGDRLSPQMGDAGTEAGDALGSAMVQRLRARLENQHDLVRGITERFNKAVDEGASDEHLSNLTHGLRSATTEASNLERELRKAMEAEGLIEKMVFGGGGGVSGNGKNDKLGDKIGALFGAGSRNNALNLFGKSIGGVINLVDKARTGAGFMFSTFIKGFSEAGAEASIFEKIMGGFSGVGSAASEGLLSLIASGPAAVAAIIAITIAMSALISVASALVALLTAIASALAGALVGALAVAGAGVTTLAAAGGLLVAAFMSMTDAQKKMLKEAFTPLRNEMVGIGQIMLQQMIPAFSSWSLNLQNALALVIPLAHEMGGAFAQAGNNITAALSGPGFQMFISSLGTYLPGIVTNLSAALGGFLNGMLGLFTAIMPYVSQFATYLAQVAARFSAWTTSAEGQNAISLFVQRALADLKSLWNMVGAFGGLIDQIFFSRDAMSAGGSIFDSIANTFRSMTAKIAAAQANGSFKKWFDDARKFGGDLWQVIKSLYNVFVSLYNSGVLSTVANLLKFMAFNFELTARAAKILISGLSFALGPVFKTFNSVIGAIGNGLGWLAQKMGIAASASQSMFGTIASMTSAAAQAIQNMPQAIIPGQTLISKSSVAPVQASGASAIAATNIPKVKTPKTYHNPYTAYANSLIKDGSNTRIQMQKAMADLNRQAAAGIKDASTGADAKAVLDSMNSLVTTLQEGGANVVSSARQALNSAAQSLASASSAKAAKAALKKVRQAQKDMRAALLDQQRTNLAAKIVASQKVVKSANVNSLVAGLKTTNVTLAEFAAARAIVATKLAAANQKLTDAISLRDDYKDQVASAAKAFGDLTTAQAKSINGVEQALTANDITSNLQDRLDKIKSFQSNLRLLLAQGLSNDAYKQIVDKGVDGGSDYAQALLNGGNGAIQQTNSLVSQISAITDSLGVETSNRLYQAGVDAAKGLVDGLTSQAAQLDAAATSLGTAIANAVKKQLGIKSPSKVMRDMMDYVGDGAVVGLDNQHIKVGNAASRLADRVAVSPEVAAYAAGQGGAPTVSRNSDQKFRDLIVQTPTEDPHAVANEVLNEVIGRL